MLLPQLLERLEGSTPYPSAQGRGVVICFGGHLMTANAYICLRRLREVSSLPVELFHSGEEIPEFVRTAWSREFSGIRFVDVSRLDPALYPGAMTEVSFRGWPIKPYAIYLSSFREVLLLDCDNFPLQDPEPLFSAPSYQEKGVLLWPDMLSARYNHDSLLDDLGLPRELNQAGPEMEAGQILMDKERCWKALTAACLLNSDDFRSQVYPRTLGDKDLYRLCCELTSTPYHLLEHPVAEVGTGYITRQVPGTSHSFHLPHRSGPFKRIGLLQFAPDGSPLFFHRTTRPWNPYLLIPVADHIKLFGKAPVSYPELAELERQGLEWLREFQSRYDGAFPFDFSRWRAARFTELGVLLLDLLTFLREVVRG